MVNLEVNKKYERVIALSAHVIRLDVQRGGLKWKVTELAKTSRVARSWIYEVLGKNKTEMRKNALKFMLEELYSLSPERTQMDRSTGRLPGLIRSRQLVRTVPEALAFYFRHRDEQTELGALIRQYEKRFLERVAADLKISDPTDLLFIRTMIHGISVAPFIDNAQAAMLAGKLAHVARSGFARA